MSTVSLIGVVLAFIVTVSSADECTLGAFISGIQTEKHVPAICAVSDSIKESLPESIKTQLQLLSAAEVSKELEKIKKVLKNLDDIDSLEELQKKLSDAAEKLTKLVKTILNEIEKKVEPQPKEIKEGVEKLSDVGKQVKEKAKEGIKKILEDIEKQQKKKLIDEITEAVPTLKSLFQNKEVKKFLGVN